MAIDYSLLPLSKGKPQSLVRHSKKVIDEAKLKAAYDKVDLRDKLTCQISGAKLSPGSVNDKRRLERDHLATRGSHPERIYDVDNILTASAFCHSLLQSCSLIPVDKRGEETTHVSKIAGYVWNRRQVSPGKEPFKLGAKEWKGK